MGKNGIRRRTWRELLRLHHPLQLPAAHDALAARLIEQAGFPAYQIGGFAVDGARFGLPEIARTDAIAPHGLKDALYRAERYLKAGADALYFDGVRNMKELKKVGSQFRGTPLVTTILEGGGETPWVPPKELYEIGFSMILYPTTILFRLTKAIQRALADLKAGRQMPEKDSVSMREFETIVDLPFWAVIETKFQGGGKEEGGSLVRKLIDSIAG